jgi:hypothetical protein
MKGCVFVAYRRISDSTPLVDASVSSPISTLYRTVLV